MLITLEPHLRTVLQRVVRAAAPQRVALVGGAVRDLLLHRVHDDPWRGLPDLDLVVEQGEEPAAGPAAHRVAERLRQEAGGTLPFCQLHGAFGTAELEIEGVLLDIATARSEWYEEPGANPLVRFGSLEEDLARRDLSINAMALVLTAAEAGEGWVQGRLLDPHGGQADLGARRLRFLHAGSLCDDPTRLVRAARYGARLGMALAPESLEQWRATLAAWPWRGGPLADAAAVPPSLGTRLRRELDLLLGREPWPAGLALLQRWGGLALLDPALQDDRRWPWRLRWAARLPSLAGLKPLPQEQGLLLALLATLADPIRVAERLQLPHRGRCALQGLMRLRDWLDEGPAGRGELSPATLSAGLERQGLPVEAVILAALGLPPGHRRRGVLRWLLRWHSLTAPVTARELIAAGMTRGPELGVRLRELRAERLDRERW